MAKEPFGHHLRVAIPSLVILIPLHGQTRWPKGGPTFGPLTKEGFGHLRMGAFRAQKPPWDGRAHLREGFGTPKSDFGLGQRAN
jgi:hypothetical protein